MFLSETEVENEYLFCSECYTWIKKFSEDHFTNHKKHWTITETQVTAQNETKIAFRDGEKKPNPMYVKIPMEISTDKNGNDVESLPSINEIGDAVLEKFRFARIKDDPKFLLFENNHVFVPNGETDLDEILVESLGEEWSPGLNESITKYIKARTTHQRKEFDANRMILNCKNCFVDLTKYEVIKKSNDILSLVQIQTNYRPDLGRSKLFEKLVRESAGEKYDEMIFEIVSCALSKQHINSEKILIFWGRRHMGKSTIITILLEVFRGATSNKSMQSLQHDRFTMIHLENKHLNAGADLPDKPLEDFDEFKHITTKGEKQSVQEKGHPQHDADIYATNIFSCNNLPALPKIDDDSIIDRITVIPFYKKFKKDDKLIEKMLKEDEKSRILNTLLYYFDRVVVNGGNLTITQTQEETQKIWREHSDSVTLFVNSLIRPIEDNEDPAVVSTVYASYVKFCHINGKAVEENRKFIKLMEREGYWSYITSVNGKSARCWGGCVLLKTAQEQTADHNQETIDKNIIKATKATHSDNSGIV